MSAAARPTSLRPGSKTSRTRRAASAGSRDIGTGTYTIMTQIAADAMGIPVEQVRFELGDTAYPETPVSGGSQTAASTGSAVKLAVEKLRDKLAAQRKASDEPWAAIVARSGQPEITAEYRTDKRGEAHSYHSHGATFADKLL